MDSEYTISPQVAPNQMGLQPGGPPQGAPAGAPPSTNSLPLGNVTITGVASQVMELSLSYEQSPKTDELLKSSISQVLI